MAAERQVVFVSLVLGWVSYFFCQRTLPSSITLMLHADNRTTDVHSESGFSKGDIGKLQTCFAVAVATSIFINGFLSDRYDPKILFRFGLITSSTLCFFFPLTEGNITLSCIIWFLFGLCQGCGWPSCVKILQQWFSSEELGTWYSILACCSNLTSGLLRYLMNQVTDWRVSFHTIGASAFLISIPLLWTVRSPSPKNSSDSKDSSESDSKHSNGYHKVEQSKPQPWYGAFLVFDLWVVALLYVMWWLAKGTVMDWGQLFLQETAKMPPKRAATTLSIMEVSSMLGKLIAGPLSVWLIRHSKKKYGASSSASVKFTMIFVVSVSLMVLLYSLGTYTSENTSEARLMAILLSIGAAVESGMTLSSLSSLEVVPKHLSGSALGLIIASGQVVGRSAAGWPFSQVVERVGWNKAYQMIGTVYIAAVALSGYLMVTFSGNWKHKHHKQE